MTGRTTRQRLSPRGLARLGDEQLLDLRFRDLPVRLEGSWLEDLLARLHAELEESGIRFRPHAWLSTEWFSPDGIPGIALPFYLAHERLMRLEKAQMLEVEGGTRASCLRILRHEAGHAIGTAYRLHYRPRWRDAFGRFSEAYPRYYRPRPDSRNHVVHLDGWYAQAHPAEDFAETFAVWLTPRSAWRRRYEGWRGALKKLECVESLIEECVRGKAPAVRSSARVEDISRLGQTLRDHYERKRAHFAVNLANDVDRQLLRIFSAEPRHRRNMTAASFLRHERPEMIRLVSAWTGGHSYTVDQLLDDMIDRCRSLRLRLTTSQRDSRTQATLMLTVHVLSHLRARRHEIPL